MAITRQACIEQSAEDFVRQAVAAAGVPAVSVDYVEAYAEPFEGPLEKEYVAMRIGYDPGGDEGELGSNLIIRTYTFEITVYGRDARRASTLAQVIGEAFDAAGVVPLKDYRTAGNPAVDHLVVLPITKEAEDRDAPKPWERHVWSLIVPIEDTFYPGVW